MLRLPLMALYLAVMDISVQSHVGGQAIGSDRASRSDGLSDEPVQSGLGQVRDRTQADAANAFSIFLGGDDNHSLDLRPPANCASLLSTPVSLVYLDDAIQPFPTRSNHGPAQFMQHRPSGLIAAQPENTLQAQSTDAILLAGDLPHGAEPDRQGQVTVLKNGSRGDRHLIPAIAAKPPIPPNRPSIGSRAPRTHPSPGPPQSCEVFGAGILAAIAPFQLQQGLRKILAHDSERYILGLVASSKYPYSQITFTERNQEVQTFTSDRSHQPFAVGVALRRPNRRPQHPDAE